MRNIFSKGLVANMIVLAIFICLVFLLTYPLILNLDDMILGIKGDNMYFIWQSWWLKASIFDLQTNTFQTDYIFYPEGINFLRGFHGILPTVMASTLQFIFSPLVSYNIIVLLLMVLAAYATYLMVKYFVKNNYIAFLAGVMMVMSPYLFIRSLGHLNLLAVCWIPLFILYLFKYYDSSKKKYLWLAALFFILNAYSSWYYLIFLSIFLAIFV